jgi:sRNA-binding carbon storage regulator CsrA
MLKLRLKDGEAIKLIDDRTGTRSEIWVYQDGRDIAIGVEAPRHIRVVRSTLEENPPPGGLNNPTLPEAKWREQAGRKFAAKRKQ